MVTTNAHDDSSALSQLSYVDPFVSMRCVHEEEAPIGVDNVSPVSSIVRRWFVRNFTNEKLARGDRYVVYDSFILAK